MEGITTPLQRALLFGKLSEVESILKEEVDGYEKSKEFGKAKRCGHIIQFLLDRKIILDIPHSDYPLLLHFAILHQDNESFDFFLKKTNVNVNAKMPELRSTLLHTVAMNGTIEMAKALLEKGLDVNAKCRKGSIPLHHACGHIKSQIFCGGHIYFHNRRAFEKKPEMVQYLLEHGSALEGRITLFEIDYKMTPLQIACSIEPGAPKIVKLLLQHGANSNVLDKFGGSLLHLAVQWETRNTDVIKLLLERGVNPNFRNNEGRTPMFNSFRSYSSQLLIEYGADVNAVDTYGNCTLHEASSNSVTKHSNKFLENFLKHKPDIDISNENGWTPLKIIILYVRDAFDSSSHARKKNVSKFFRTFYAYVTKCEACNELIPRNNSELHSTVNQLRHDTQFKDIIRICDSEMNRMKQKKISDSCTVSYFDFLTGNLRKLTALARNEDLMGILALGKYEKMFPHYATYLTDAINLAKSRQSSYKRCSVPLKKIVKRLKLQVPYCITEEIFHYLSAKDLQNFEDSSRDVLV